MESFKRYQEKRYSDDNEVFEASLPLTVNRFHTLCQYSGFIDHFEDVLFHAVVYSGRLQLVPQNSKIAKGKDPTPGIRHLAHLC